MLFTGLIAAGFLLGGLIRRPKWALAAGLGAGLFLALVWQAFILASGNGVTGDGGTFILLITMIVATSCLCGAGSCRLLGKLRRRLRRDRY